MVNDEVLIGWHKISFWGASYFNDGTLNRKHIASIVFNDDEELAHLNSLVHPATFRAFDAWVAGIRRRALCFKRGGSCYLKAIRIKCAIIQ